MKKAKTKQFSLKNLLVIGLAVALLAASIAFSIWYKGAIFSSELPGWLKFLLV